MLRLLRKIVLLSSFFAIYTFANDAMISQMSSAFFSSFFSFFLPIVALGAILSVCLSLAQKRPEFLAYGCGGIFLSVFIVGLILTIFPEDVEPTYPKISDSRKTQGINKKFKQSHKQNDEHSF